MSEGQESLAASPEPEAHSSPRLGTEYVVLKLVGSQWQEMIQIVAGSSDAAIRSYANDTKEPGTFVAVPVRSFVRRTVLTETTTIVNLT